MTITELMEGLDYLENNDDETPATPDIIQYHASNYCIFQRQWLKYCQRNESVPLVISPDERIRFYRTEYVIPFRLYDMPAGVDFCFFQWAVINEKSQDAVRDLQLCVGEGPTGIMDETTLRSIWKADPIKTIRRLLDRQMRFYRDELRHHPDAPVLGWEHRIVRTRQFLVHHSLFTAKELFLEAQETIQQ